MNDTIKGQIWSRGNIHDFKEFRIFLREYYGGLFYSEDILNWYVKKDSVMIFSRDKQTGYISGSIIAIPIKMKIEKINERCYIVDFLCLEQYRRSHTFSKLFFNRLGYELKKKHKKFIILFNSMLNLETPLSVSQHYDRYVSFDVMLEYKQVTKPRDSTHEKLLRKKYDANLPKFLTAEEFQKMTVDDTKLVLELFRNKSSKVKVLHNSESVKDYISKPGMINTMIRKDKVTGRITDLVSYYILKLCINNREIEEWHAKQMEKMKQGPVETGDKEPEKKFVLKANLLDIVSEKYSKKELIDVALHCARIDNCFTFTILGIDGMDRIADQLKMTKFKQNIYYHLVTYNVDTTLAHHEWDTDLKEWKHVKGRAIHPDEISYYPRS